MTAKVCIKMLNMTVYSDLLNYFLSSKICLTKKGIIFHKVHRRKHPDIKASLDFNLKLTVSSSELEDRTSTTIKINECPLIFSHFTLLMHLKCNPHEPCAVQ